MLRNSSFPGWKIQLYLLEIKEGEAWLLEGREEGEKTHMKQDWSIIQTTCAAAPAMRASVATSGCLEEVQFLELQLPHLGQKAGSWRLQSGRKVKLSMPHL